MKLREYTKITALQHARNFEDGWDDNFCIPLSISVML